MKYSNTQLLTSRVNTIASLPSGATTNDARLEDICVGYDSTNYSSPGESVRNQVNNLHTDLNNYIKISAYYNNIIKETGKYLGKDRIRNTGIIGAEWFNLDNIVVSYHTDFIPTVPGNIFKYHGTGDAQSYSCAWFDSNKNLLYYNQYVCKYGYINIITPENASYVIFNSYGTILDVQILRNDVYNNLNLLYYNIYKNLYLTVNGKLERSYGCISYITDYIRCTYNDTFYYYGNGTNDAPSVCWFDKDYNLISYDVCQSYVTSLLIAPENACYAKFSSYRYISSTTKLMLNVSKNTDDDNIRLFIENSIDMLKINSLNEDTKNFPDKSSQKNDICTIDNMYKDGYIHYITGGIVIDQNLNAQSIVSIYSDLYNIEDHPIIYLSARASVNTSLLTLYDDDGNHIYTLDKESYNDDITVTDKRIDLRKLTELYPNATKFRVGSYRYGDRNNSAFKCYEYSISDNIYEKFEKIDSQLSTYINFNSNILTGKKYVSAGDSFTEGDFSGYTDLNGLSGRNSPVIYDSTLKMYKTYPYWIGKRNNMTIINEARCGTTMAIHRNYFLDPDNFDIENATHFANKRYKNIPDDADYLTLCFGLNEQSLYPTNPSADHYNSELAGQPIVPMGSSSDYTDKTIWGAWNLSLDYIIEHHPFLKIGIIIADAWTNVLMHNTLISIAKYWGIPYLDLRNGENVPIGINGRLENSVCPRAIQLRDNAFKVSLNNSHPNLEAHKYRSTIIENFLRSL